MPIDLDPAVTALLPRSSGFAPAGLLDIQTGAGAQYFIASMPGQFPSRFDGSMQVYKPWLKSAGPFRLTRTLRTDSGDVILQNISGNLISKDVASAFANNEFEGAYAVFRYWHLLAEKTIREFHGYMTAAQQPQGEAHFKMLQLLDGSDINVPDGTYANNCGLRFKSEKCGSTSSHLTCLKTLAVCTALEHFDGLPTPPSLYLLTPATVPESLKIRSPLPVRRLGL